MSTCNQLVFVIVGGCSAFHCFNQKLQPSLRANILVPVLGGMQCTGSRIVCSLLHFMQNPAADIAAQVATALALSAKVARDHGTPADAASANQWETLAQRAYNYAKSQFTALQGAASCSNSPANTNCVGSGCVPTDGVRNFDLLSANMHRSW